MPSPAIFKFIGIWGLGQRKRGRTLVLISGDLSTDRQLFPELRAKPNLQIRKRESDRLENVFDSFADTFSDFPGSLCRADADVLARGRAALSNSPRRINRMQRNQVCGALSRARS